MTPNASNPARGEVWTVNLNPTIGREQAGMRPALIVSADPLNASARGLVIVLPITSTARSFPSHISVDPPEAGLTKPSQVMTEQIRAISKERLVRRIGTCSGTTLDQVDQTLRFVLGMV